MKGIDPKYIMYLGLLVGIEQAIGHGTVSLTNLIPESWAPYVTSWCNFLAFTGTSIMTYQAAVSSPLPGPMFNTPIAPAAKVAIVLAALGLGLFAMPGDARAQVKPLQITGHLRADTKANLGLAKTAPAAPAPAAADPNVVTTIDGLLTKLENIQNKVVTDVISDIQAADTDAGAVITPATATVPAVVNDPISHACYPAAVQFLQSLPVAKPTTGTLFGVQLFQKKRDFVNQLKAGLPAYLKIGCGALVGDEVQIFVTLMGMVGVTVATGGITGLLPAATLLPAIPALAL